jgi:hypothetical protein
MGRTLEGELAAVIPSMRIATSVPLPPRRRTA